MTDAVIRVRNIGKLYEIGERGYGYKTLRESLVGALRNPFRASKNGHSSNGHSAKALANAGHAAEPAPRTFWALKDISFDVQRGEIVGIIGRNGAGKSTLLKILSRITDPTEGEVEIEGRVGSLLEVGTGFHPELTGRENIFLNGAILGMKRAEIAARFDEIVAFAGTEKFLDTPVKYYSSGMYMRLAFAIAAHLEPEILIVDEVLAVGDAEFQKKCLGKIGDVARSGRTVLLVSHQMNPIRRLADRVIWLESGKIHQLGDPREVVAAYELASANTGARENDSSRCFLGWEIIGSGNALHDGMNEVTLRLEMHLSEPIVRGHLGINIFNDIDALVGGWGFDGLNIPHGFQNIDMALPVLPLKPGVYSIRCALLNYGSDVETGAQLVGKLRSLTPLVVDSTPVAHPQDEWSGLLNIPGTLSVSCPSAMLTNSECERASEAQ